DYRELRAELARRLSSARDVDGALRAGCELLERALDASAAKWQPAAKHPLPGHPTITLGARRSEACIVVSTAIEPSFEIIVGELRGGRTLLSDDLVLIDGVASSVGRRIDEIRLELERAEREQREREVLR